MRVLVVSGDRSDPDGHPINLGDALLTDALLHGLRSRGHEAVAADLGPGAASRTDRASAAGLSGLRRLVAGSDAVVVGGGTLIQQDSARPLRSGMVRLVGATCAMARFTGRPVALFGVGVEPVDDRLTRWLYSLTLPPGRVWLRDQESVSLLRSSLRRNARLTADACWLGPDIRSNQTMRNNTVTLALHYRHAAGVRADHVATLATTSEVTFLAMSRHGEHSDAGSLPTPVRDQLARVDAVDPATALGVIANGKSVLASRMHALYLAAMTQTPMTAIADSPKLRSFVDEFGVPHARSLDEAVHLAPALADREAVDRARHRAQTGLDALLAAVVPA